MSQQAKKKTILVTNDDGVNARGILALKEELDQIAFVEVYAPDRNWSAASRTMTFHKPLRVDRVRLLNGSIGHMTSGTPSDCVSLAILGLMKEKPDLVVSGINAGLNMGEDVTYSGTVAAAMQGARTGIPAIAISMDTEAEDLEIPDYSKAAQFTARLAALLLEENPLPPGVLLNINVPRIHRGKPAEVKITRLGGLVYKNYLVQGKDPRGRSYYWITGEPRTQVPKEEEGTDIWAITNGCISVTPIHLDMTYHPLLDKISDWEEKTWFA